MNRPTPRYRYDAGHTVFVPADKSIWGYSDSIKSTRDLRLHVDLDTLPTVLGEDLNRSKATAPVLMLYDERVTSCAALLAEECISTLPENRMFGESLTMALMAALFASHEASNRALDNGLARWQLRRVLEFLEAHLAEDINLDELAQLVGLSQSQFARAFKVSTGLPPYQWCVRNRVKRAQEMPLKGSDSLTDIAIQNGFADQSHFTKTFRRVTGATPANENEFIGAKADNPPDGFRFPSSRTVVANSDRRDACSDATLPRGPYNEGDHVRKQHNQNPCCR